jgi:GntP family gluconate:H+ symporter
MPIVHVAVFVSAVAAVIYCITRWRAEPVVALILGAAGFGVACGMSLGQIGKSFGNGFGAAAAGPGLTVLATALIATVANAGGATQWIRDWALRRRGLVNVVTPGAGLVAGIGAVPSSAFVLLSPVRAAAAANPIRLALAILAGQGLLLPSPVLVAATTILAADWRLVLAIGLPCAVLLLLVANAFGKGRQQHFAPAPIAQARGLPAAGLVAVTVALICLLIVQSFGDIPSEPFGGGSARELLLGLGRPFILLLVGIAGVSVFARRLPATDIAIRQAAPMILLLGAAGGLQAMAQDSRMADTLAETIAATHIGLAAPFMVAACLKMLLGSSPVAAISAAGLLQPALSGLGLDDSVGHACAALAVGAGAVSGVHINDGFFWLVTDAARVRPARGMVLIFGGSLLQGVLAVVVLSIVHAAGKSLLF